jgi:hypothetical protein
LAVNVELTGINAATKNLGLRSYFERKYLGSVEICITLGRMTDSPFSPVHPVPAK